MPFVIVDAARGLLRCVGPDDGDCVYVWGNNTSALSRETAAQVQWRMDARSGTAVPAGRTQQATAARAALAAGPAPNSNVVRARRLWPLRRSRVAAAVGQPSEGCLREDGGEGEGEGEGESRRRQTDLDRAETETD